MSTYSVSGDADRLLKEAALKNGRSPTKELAIILAEHLKTIAPVVVRPDLTIAQYDAWEALGKPIFTDEQWSDFVNQEETK